MSPWLVLVLSLPTENATARMRAWRMLKAMGAAVLRDGVYLMPSGGQRQETLRNVARDVEGSGGIAYLLELAGSGDYPFPSLFDRTEDYRKLGDEAAGCRAGLSNAIPQALARQARKLRKAFDQIAEIDFFPGEARSQAEALLADLDRRIQSKLSPDEPTGTAGRLPRRSRSEFQRRLWATRKDPWVDRLGSAWLIRRCIDPAARFLWLESSPNCPAGAVGFDFDGAAFSHTETPSGMLVTFETLLASFGLDDDPALARIGRIVHFLDIGGIPAPEAAGLECLLRGMKLRLDDDDSLLAEASRLFDDFRRIFHEESETR